MKVIACFAFSAALLVAQDSLKSYESVIPKDAASQDGIFTAHQVGDKLYYEIPAEELGKEFLWSVRLARTIPGVSIRSARVSTHTVRWERRADTVLLKKTHYAATAEVGEPIARAVDAVHYTTIVASFPIEALGPADAAVIEVTKLFTTEVPEFSARSVLGARGFDSSRSYVEHVAAYPRNVNVEAVRKRRDKPAGSRG